MRRAGGHGDATYETGQVKVNLGGTPRLDEEGNVVPGRMVDMVVEGQDVYIVSASPAACLRPQSSAEGFGN